MKYEKERCELIECARAMEHYGLVMLSGGNVSLRMKDGTFLVTPSAMAYDSMIPEDIVLVNGKGETIEGKRRPTSDLEAILYIFEKMPDVNVVLHFQSEYATAISCMKNKPTNFNVTAEIPCHVGSEIPVIPYYRPGSPELAKAVVEAMLKHNSVLLTNHGQVVCGKDFDQVYERATFFEMACRIIVQSGGDYSVLTPEEIEDLEIYVLGKKTK